MADRDRVPPRRSDASPARAVVPPAASHPVVALQQSVGNRAAVQILSRKLAIKPEDLGSTGGVGAVKALVGQSDYTKLRETLAKYHATSIAAERAELVARMKMLAARWLHANAKGKSAGNQSRIAKVVDLQAALVAEEAELAEQVSYLSHLGEKKDPHYRWLSGGAVNQALEPAQQM